MLTLGVDGRGNTVTHVIGINHHLHGNSDGTLVATTLVRKW